jgi:uncharacterized protein YndB with AHSA1/START domain
MIDIEHEIAAIHRQVERRDGDEAPEVGVVVRRTYDAHAPDVWDAIADPDRLRRWFLPVSATCGRAARSSSRATQAGGSCAASHRGC